MSLSLEQAQWLVQFMQNLPGADREYEDATHAQRVQAAHGLNVQQQQQQQQQQHAQPEHTGYEEGGFEAGYAEAPFYAEGYGEGYENGYEGY